MNLRILKKLSKRAAPLLLELDDHQFGTVRHFVSDDEAHTSTVGHDRKHWQRSRGVHNDATHGAIVYQPRRPCERYPYVWMREPWDVWPGTAMVGWTSGYETPEWEERTAWEQLAEIVHESVTEYHYEPTGYYEWGPGYEIEAVVAQRLRNPRDVFRRASELVLELEADRRARQARRAA